MDSIDLTNRFLLQRECEQGLSYRALVHERFNPARPSRPLS